MKESVLDTDTYICLVIGIFGMLFYCKNGNKYFKSLCSGKFIASPSVSHEVSCYVDLVIVLSLP
jgi:hypothetical protein